MGAEDRNHEPSTSQVSFTTPYDDLIPTLEDSEAQFILMQFESIWVYVKELFP